VKRELKWKSDAAAAAAAAAGSSSAGSSDTTEHQQNVVRSCISRLRRGSDLKKTVTPRTTTTAELAAQPSSVAEEQEEPVMNRSGDVTKKAVVTTTVSRGHGSADDVTPMKTSRGGAPGDVEFCESETELGRRRQRVLELLGTAEGQRMVRQMFVVRDELKQELAFLAQRLRRIDHHIETMLLQSGST